MVNRYVVNLVNMSGQIWYMQKYGDFIYGEYMVNVVHVPKVNIIVNIIGNISGIVDVNGENG